MSTITDRSYTAEETGFGSNAEAEADMRARLDAAESFRTYAHGLAQQWANWGEGWAPPTADEATMVEALYTARELETSVGVCPPPTRIVVCRNVWPTARAESDPCEKGTPGCSVTHTTDTDCEGW